MRTRLVEFDASQYHTVLDFYRALGAALGSPTWHGTNINALIDSMVYGGINAIDPPYTLKITGISNLPEDVRDELFRIADAIKMAQRGEPGVEFQIEP
jgi:RNAse (barnase) inhibitor barstar